MNALTLEEMAALPAGGGPLRTTCGVAVGFTAGASLAWGLAGFLMTINKALAVCGLAAAL